jgi:hypothetical protein
MSLVPFQLLSFSLVASLALFSIPLQAEEGTPEVQDNSRRTAQRLSSDPSIDIQQGVCYVRGAVWLDSRGPMRNEQVALVDQSGNIHAVGLTDRYGFYQVSLVLPEGKGLVLKEQDHNSRRRSPIWSRGATVLCAKPTVDVGEVMSLTMNRPL